ncbi:isocitrate lyase/PEP mutase family protein [Ancylobacter sp. Lp-2]|uniref:isocitrate lyase/PEP mutase family protein n=1 Tax=Ancylobacter sp. Lp-2 TaxID=2881339 RepID=UPI001E59F4B5|nr:isocitrate lyase/PEP mutase family protein [Ancylobacter sp. Lp-2]MCB4771573.1 isocitrate lyase/PEP mutase family protein [Ancylobacter sp. Lp-2]
MLTKAQEYRRMLTQGEFIVSPGVYDGYSARLVEAAGFSSAASSGAAVSNSILGIADIGVMGLNENLNHCRNIARSISIPLTCDADTGYGNAVNVYHTTRLFEEAGIAGINIEDQVSPKRCGHMSGKEVIPLDEMVKKIEAACLARRDDAFVIIARTDALAVEGLNATVERAKAYVAAGADLVFPDAVGSEVHIKMLVDSGIPLSVNMGFGIRKRPTTPLIPLADLRKWGVRRVSLPRMLPAAAIKAMTEALQVMKEAYEQGISVDRPDLLVGIEDIMKLMDYEGGRELECRLLPQDTLKAKYERSVAE